MSWHDDDDLDGDENLDDRQIAAVLRYRGRVGRYQRERIRPSQRDAWAAFEAAEESDERYRFRRS